MRIIAVIAFSFIMSIAIVSAQSDSVCQELRTIVLEIAGAFCEDVGRNEVCYGFNNVDALDFGYQSVRNFSQAGDVVPIRDIASLTTAPFNAENKTWGFALLSIQANLPDTLPEQNVTLILFGDTEIIADEALDSDNVKFLGQATGSINVRRGAGTNYGILDGLQTGETVTIIGRNEASDWLLIELEDATRAWVFAPLLRFEGELESLAIRTPTTSSPMQAFQIRTGFASAACGEVPQDGLLIQTPDNTRVNFLINGIEVEIANTALIRADEKTMTLSTFAGEAILEAEGVSQIIEPGLQSSVTTGEAPTEAEPYSVEAVRYVPVELLPESVEIPPPSE
jgi:Bacterial SH3 domain